VEHAAHDSLRRELARVAGALREPTSIRRRLKIPAILATAMAHRPTSPAAISPDVAELIIAVRKQLAVFPCRSRGPDVTPSFSVSA
jgi:hypothetical protein